MASKHDANARPGEDKKCANGASSSKKVKRTCTYSEKYAEKYPFLRRGSDDGTAFCGICGRDFGCNMGGMNDVDM